MSDIRNYYKVTGILSGGVWLGGAICSLFDSILFSALASIFILTGIIIGAFRIFWIKRMKMEDFDEMAETNLTKAKAFALSILQVCILPIMIISLLNAIFKVSINIEDDTLALFALGIGEMVTGMKFLSLERNGDSMC